MLTKYETNLRHLWDEQRKLDLLIRIKLEKMGARDSDEAAFKGLYISDEEVSGILESSTPLWNEKILSLENQLDELIIEIEMKKKGSKKEGILLSLPALAMRFHLNPFETDAFFICMAPELDRKYEKLYAYLQDDVTRKSPSIGLILDLLCDSWEQKMQAKNHFDAERPLLKNSLIRFAEDRSERSVLTRPLAADGRVVSYILASGTIENNHAEIADVQKKEDEISLDGTLLQDDVRTSIQNLIMYLKIAQKGICYLQGPYGSGKKAVADLIASRLGVRIMPIDFEALIAKDAVFESILSTHFRDAALQDRAVYLDNFHALSQNSKEPKNFSQKKIVLEQLERLNGIIFISSQEDFDQDLRIKKDIFKIGLSIPDYSMRRQVWRKNLPEDFADDEISELATKFRFTPGQINDAIAAAQNQAVLQGRIKFSIEDLYQGCRAQSNRMLSSLARKIEPCYAWEDLVLPMDKIQQLKEIRNHIKNRGLVYHEWGFGEKQSLGKGLNVLFLGPSGTGKTMAAEVMASELRLDMYKIDLSSVVSKYIGETEKNLNRIFKEAEQSNAMLFFDEADAIFGKRSEVRDSHDRYANVEISYLLQKMEEHEGVVILASNLSGNIDGAFLRRMHFTVEFPFPEEEYRLKIWRSMIPKEVPLSDDIDFYFLARKFKISGGNIRNIIVNSAFLAAEDSRVISMENIVNATKREYQKMKKACSPSDFGKYLDNAL